MRSTSTCAIGAPLAAVTTLLRARTLVAGCSAVTQPAGYSYPGGTLCWHEHRARTRLTRVNRQCFEIDFFSLITLALLPRSAGYRNPASVGLPTFLGMSQFLL